MPAAPDGHDVSFTVTMTLTPLCVKASGPASRAEEMCEVTMLPSILLPPPPPPPLPPLPPLPTALPGVGIEGH